MEGISFIKHLLFFIFMIGMIPSASAQEFHHIVGDYPFATSIDLDSLQSGDVNENAAFGSHHSKRIQNSKLGVFSRYFELANSENGIPNYYNIQFGGSYKHFLNDEKSIGFIASFGSSSDKPFKNGRDGTILLNSTYQLNEKWVILGNYSNNRSFLNNVPLPGFIYVHQQSRDNNILLGFPFMYVLTPFYEDIFSFKYVGVLPYNHKMRILFNRLALIKPYVGIEQGPIIFFDSGRTSDNDRTFWFERKAALGFEKSFGPLFRTDFQIGNSFNREYFIAQSFAREHKSVQKIHDAVYISLSLKSSF